MRAALQPLGPAIRAVPVHASPSLGRPTAAALGIGAAILLCVGWLGCAGARGPAPTGSAQDGEILALADAGPSYYAPHEVDATPVLLTPIEPRYPPELRVGEREGDVLARVYVREDGTVAGAQLVEASDAAFVALVRTEIARARFAPAVRAGRHVASWVLVRVRFRLG
ncbi:MAG TPA: energy transducer TonB [Myxococcota bacterium]|nr:energy transducer TonB [Myxococcota bacterium]